MDRNQNKLETDPLCINSTPFNHDLQMAHKCDCCHSNSPSEFRPESPLGKTTISHSTFDIKNKINKLEKSVNEGHSKYLLQNVAQKTLNNKRLSSCMSSSLGSDVHVIKTEHGVHYGNLMTCGLGWVCPVCSAKISEKRRVELSKAVNTNSKNNGYNLLITLTFPHYKFDNLDEILEKMKNALRRFKGSRKYQELKERIGLIGSVRCLEVTHGSNGWHPHTHDLFFLESDEYSDESKMKELEKEIYELWAKACVQSGLPAPNLKYGVDVKGGEFANDYITKFGKDAEKKLKWRVDSELSKSHSKSGKSGSRTPFDILRDIYVYDLDSDKKLFQEYSKSFKGKRQLVWSRGLKNRFDIDEKTDKELVDETEENGEIIGTINKETWKLVCKYELRGQLLLICNDSGWDGVIKLFDDVFIEYLNSS